MARDFAIGKKTILSSRRPEVLNSTRRAWKPNLQKVCTLVDGRPKRIWVSTRTSKFGKVTRV